MDGGNGDFQGTDRRASRRRPSPVNRLIRAELEASGAAPQALYLYMVDLSEGGLRINADRPLPDETSLQLRFGLEGFPVAPVAQLEVKVQKAWDKTLAQGTWTSGLRFVDLPPEIASLVQGLLAGFTPESKRQNFRLREPISVSLQVEEEGPWKVTVPMNLSPTSLSLRAYAEVSLDQTIQVMLRFPEKQGHFFPARVTRLENLEAGRQELDLELLEPSPQLSAEIQAYIDKACGLTG